MNEQIQTQTETQTQQEQNKYILLFEAFAKENNITFEYSFKSNVGRADIDKRHIKISKPINRNRFYVALHEIGHIINGHIKPRYIEEMRAEQYAINQMKYFKIPLSRKMRERAKKYISYKIRQAQRRGLKKVDSTAKRFIQ